MRIENHNSNKNQDIKGKFVAREVIHNASYMLRELRGSESFRDEVYELFYSTYSEEEGYEDELIEPYEFWIVTDWLGDKLKAQGEIVADFMGFTIWGRTTTGQAILLDYVISKICHDLEILEGQENEWK